MKKSIYAIIYVTAIWLFPSCSDDHYKFTRPEVAGIDIPQDHIQLVFLPDESNNTLSFSLMTKNRDQEDILINWGDDNKLHPYSPGEITYEFPEEEGEYIITIQAAEIFSVDLTKTGCDQLKSIFLGECPLLDSFKLINQHNKLRDLDFRKCPQFSDYFYLNIYNPEFNFTGMNNFGSLNFNIICDNLSVVIEDYAATSIRVYFEQCDGKKIFMNNCPALEKLEIYANPINHKRPSLIEEITLNIESLDRLDTYQITLPNKLNLWMLSSASLINLQNTNCKETIIFPSSLKHFNMDNTSIMESYWNDIEYLDFSNCTDLDILHVVNVARIEEININGLENIHDVYISNVGSVENYQYRNPDIPREPGPLSRQTKQLQQNGNELPEILSLKAN